MCEEKRDLEWEELHMIGLSNAQIEAFYIAMSKAKAELITKALSNNEITNAQAERLREV